MTDLRFQSCSIIIGTRHLREGGLVDGGADLRFKLDDVLTDLLIAQPALKGLLQLLDVVRGKVDRRHTDVGYAKHDPLVGAGAGGLNRERLARRKEAACA